MFTVALSNGVGSIAEYARSGQRRHYYTLNGVFKTISNVIRQMIMCVFHFVVFNIGLLNSDIVHSVLFIVRARYVIVEGCVQRENLVLWPIVLNSNVYTDRGSRMHTSLYMCLRGIAYICVEKWRSVGYDTACRFRVTNDR